VRGPDAAQPMVADDLRVIKKWPAASVLAAGHAL